MNKTKSVISWGQLFIVIGVLILFIFALTQRATFEKEKPLISVEGFSFSGSAITSYEGDLKTIEIPTSYSYGKSENFAGTITFYDIGQAFDFMQTHYTTGASGYYDFYTRIYQESYPWVYEYSIDKPSFVKGNDIKITSIANSAFNHNNNIEKIIIPSTITEIESFAFQYCYQLKEIEFSEGLISIGDSSFWGTSITKITLPNTLETISPYAFFDCTKLEEIVIGENVKNMNLGTFNNCKNLKKVTILSNFEIKAFETDVYQTFSKCPNLEAIYVKQELLDYYKNTSPWNRYEEKYKAL